jgi:type II secretory ATPase GspE/PulE/Tfp pilus assembly ATPase PilB-like protein
VPIAGDGDEAVVLIDDPSDRQRIFEIDKILNARNYVINIGLPEDILRYLEKSDDDSDANSFASVLKLLEDKDKTSTTEHETNIELDEKLASTSGMIQLVKRIIIEACDMGGSDIHIEPGNIRSPGVVRVRVDGDCKKLQEIPREHMAALIARIKVISGMDISERRLPQDGKCIETIHGQQVDLRATTYPTDGGESAVLRILPRGGVTPLNKLNLSEDNYQRIKRIASKQHGMFLVVGPTGVGKTVTLHAVLDYLNEPGIKILTAEDPIEITQPGLQQIQMKPKIGLTFASAMRSFLRGDPDVILVGEMRDAETANIAIEGSLTGHLVLSTLHSNSATETITRLLNLGMEPVDFSDALLGIMSQRLVKTLCTHCKTSYEPSSKELNFLIESYGEELFPELEMKKNDIRLYRPVGCKKCEDTGYLGRTAVHELLTMTGELQQLILGKAPQSEIKAQAIAEGMRTLKQDGIHKIFLGMTDYTQLNRVVSD